MPNPCTAAEADEAEGLLRGHLYIGPHRLWDAEDDEFDTAEVWRGLDGRFYWFLTTEEGDIRGPTQGPFDTPAAAYADAMR